MIYVHFCTLEKRNRILLFLRVKERLTYHFPEVIIINQAVYKQWRGVAVWGPSQVYIAKSLKYKLQDSSQLYPRSNIPPIQLRSESRILTSYNQIILRCIIYHNLMNITHSSIPHPIRSVY